MPRSGHGATIRVGLLVLGAVLVLMAGIFMIGEQNRIFTSKNRYSFTVASVSGLNQGSPVRLNGVTVGLVERITLPEDVRQQLLTVRISIEKQYEKRIRADSAVRIRTIGLLGDKYVDVSSGSADAPVIEPGGTIPTAPVTDVDQLITSGGDVVDNLVRISYSLNSILGRVDRGEGLIGELTTGESSGIAVRLDATMATAERLMNDVEGGKGPLGRLLRDEVMADRLSAAVTDLEQLMASANRGDGLVASVLRDPNTRQEFEATLGEARQTAAQLRRWTAEIEQSDGLVDRLLTDSGMGDRVSRDLEGIVSNLHEVSRKLNRGEGTASKLINDPKIYDAVNDIIVGVEESPLLRWLVRSRQKKGIEKRYEEESGQPAPPSEEPEAPPGSTPTATPPESSEEPAPGGESPADEETQPGDDETPEVLPGADPPAAGAPARSGEPTDEEPAANGGDGWSDEPAPKATAEPS